jgi:hypothetical protein
LSDTERTDIPITDSEAAPTVDLDPMSAAELAQELTLITQAMFAQLQPDAAAYALSGVPGLDGEPTLIDPAPADALVLAPQTGPPVHEAVPAPATEQPAPPMASVPMPSLPSALPRPVVPVEVTAIAMPEMDLPATAVPVVDLAAPQDDLEADEPTPAAVRIDRRRMAILEEIRFLDG